MEHQNLISKPIELIKGVNRPFGVIRQGIVRSLFTFTPLAKTVPVWYTDIDWFDKSYSSFPANKIRGLAMNAIWKFPIKIGRNTIEVPCVHRFIFANFVVSCFFWYFLPVSARFTTCF